MSVNYLALQVPKNTVSSNTQGYRKYALGLLLKYLYGCYIYLISKVNNKEDGINPLVKGKCNVHCIFVV